MKTLPKYLTETITSYICEGVFNYAPATAEEARAYFNSIGRSIKRDNKTIKTGELVPTEFIDLMFNIWIDNFEKEPNKIPFRCDGKSVKLSASYEIYKDDILGLQDNIDNCKINFTTGKFTINDYTIKFGEGSLKGVTSAKGLSYEDTVVEQLIKTVELIAGKHSEGRLTKKDFEETITDKTLHCLYNMYDAGHLDEVLELYINSKDNPIDLSTIIIKTGGGNTKRNSNGEIFDSEFNVTNSDIETVLEDSGNIIADVTINTKTPVYISVKMKSSQLSGVMYKKAIAQNETFKNAVMSNETWDDIKTAKEMVPFINFFNVLGIVPSDIFTAYKQIYSGKSSKDIELTLNKNYDPTLLGCVFQKLLGGNYWYVKPGICEYVDYKDAGLKFNIDKASITSTGKGISVIGNINGLKAHVNFRTDGDRTVGPYPYRLFPQISVPDLIKKV
jgi:hypothetical protein